MHTVRSRTLPILLAGAAFAGAAHADTGVTMSAVESTPAVSTQNILINREVRCSQLELASGMSGAECGVMSTPELSRYFIDLND